MAHQMHTNQSRSWENNELSRAESEYYEPSHYALGLIQRAVANQQNVGIGGSATGELYVFPKSGEYLCLAQDKKEFFATPARDLHVRVLEKAEAEELIGKIGVGRNIDELMWIAAQIASDGRLMVGCNPGDVVHLKHWPNLTRLPLNPNTLRLAALFSRYPTSLHVAKRMLGVPQWEINEFYSSAKASGLASSANRASEYQAEKLKPYRNRTLLEKIIDRISSL